MIGVKIGLLWAALMSGIKELLDESGNVIRDENNNAIMEG